MDELSKFLPIGQLLKSQSLEYKTTHKFLYDYRISDTIKGALEYILPKLVRCSGVSSITPPTGMGMQWEG